MNEASRLFVAEMQKKLTDNYSLDEIETLSFVLGVDYDSLRGGAKPTKVNSLLSYLGRTGRLSLLVDQVRTERDHVLWPELPQDFELPQGPGVGEGNGATIYQIGMLHTGGGLVNMGTLSAGGDVTGRDAAAVVAPRKSSSLANGGLRAAMIAVESNLDRSARIAQALPYGDVGHKAELAVLLVELRNALGRSPVGQMDQAEMLARRVEKLADEAGSPRPDRDYVSDLYMLMRDNADRLETGIAGIRMLVDAIISSFDDVIG